MSGHSQKSLILGDKNHVSIRSSAFTITPIETLEFIGHYMEKCQVINRPIYYMYVYSLYIERERHKAGYGQRFPGRDSTVSLLSQVI